MPHSEVCCASSPRCRACTPLLRAILTRARMLTRTRLCLRVSAPILSPPIVCTVACAPACLISPPCNDFVCRLRLAGWVSAVHVGAFHCLRRCVDGIHAAASVFPNACTSGAQFCIPLSSFPLFPSRMVIDISVLPSICVLARAAGAYFHSTRQRCL